MGQLVLVSGAPGAGKSALARPLAALLGLPLLSKDVIKESLFDTLGHVADDELASSRQLGGAAMELLWRLAARCPAVVLEANFRSQSAYERKRVLELTSCPWRCTAGCLRPLRPNGMRGGARPMPITRFMSHERSRPTCSPSSSARSVSAR